MAAGPRPPWPAASAGPSAERRVAGRPGPEGRLYVPTAAGLVALSTAGEPLWSSAEDDGVTVRPAVAAGVVFTGTADGVRGQAADGCAAPACDATWSATTGSQVTGAPAVAAGRLYVGTQDGDVVAYGRPPA